MSDNTTTDRKSGDLSRLEDTVARPVTATAAGSSGQCAFGLPMIALLSDLSPVASQSGDHGVADGCANTVDSVYGTGLGYGTSAVVSAHAVSADAFALLASGGHRDPSAVLEAARYEAIATLRVATAPKTDAPKMAAPKLAIANKSAAAGKFAAVNNVAVARTWASRPRRLLSER